MKPFNLKLVPKAVADAAAKSLPIKCVKAEGDVPAELRIMEQIGEDWWGDGVSATDVLDFVAEQSGKPINVRINSPGGFVYDGMVIYNALASHTGRVTVTVEGLAFSMASVIAMAGDVVRMYQASDFGIHRAWGMAVGNQKDMRASAEWLMTIDQHLVDIYSEKTGKDAGQINAWMDGESDGTLFSAVDALANGFADEVIDPKAEKEGKSAIIHGAKSAMRSAASASSRLQMARAQMLVD